MKHNIFYIILILVVSGCTKPKSPFVNEVDKFIISIGYPQDNNGYYHVPIDTSTNANRFNIFVEGSQVIPEYQYNGITASAAQFDCDSYFMLGDNGPMTITLPTYNPFGGIHTSPNYTSPFPVGDTTLVLEQFAHLIEKIVPDETIYLKEPYIYDEYTPQDGNNWGKRIVGPVPSSFYGDTIKIFCKITWDCGNYSLEYPEETNIVKEIKIIFN